MVLQKGGWMSYVGPIGRHGRSMVAYVQTLPGAHPCPKSMNPASWILDVLSGSNSTGVGTKVCDADAAFLRDGAQLQQFLLASPSWAKSSEQLASACVPAPGSAPFSFSSVYARSYLEQLAACTMRASRSLFRNTSYMFFKMMMGAPLPRQQPGTRHLLPYKLCSAWAHDLLWHHLLQGMHRGR